LWEKQRNVGLKVLNMVFNYVSGGKTKRNGRFLFCAGSQSEVRKNKVSEVRKKDVKRVGVGEISLQTE
jgi:hypothetical protein